MRFVYSPLGILCLHRWTFSADCAGDQPNDQQNQKDEEENLGDPGRRSGDAAEAEYACDQRNYKEDNSPSEHGSNLSVMCEYDLGLNQESV